MPRVCNIAGREGLYWLQREFSTNSRVQLIPEGDVSLPASEKVATASLLNVRVVDTLPRPDGSTAFRQWFRQMTSAWGSRPEWPKLLCELLNMTYLKERDTDRTYKGRRIVTDRGTDPVSTEDMDENGSVRNLFNCCHEKANGCLTIGQDAFWLLGFQVTNQDRHQGRRADLLALNMEGGLVVFEAKLATNGYAPICALLEGLDYLACLTCDGNFGKVREEIKAFPRPAPFQDVELLRHGRHEVVVLAESDYFHGTFTRSPRGKGWKELAQIRPEDGECIQLRFASTDFNSPVAEWEYGS